jgi:trimeric autotransporter adhesin
VTSFNGDLYFQANDSTTGAELWRNDGTRAGTSQVADINAGPGSSYPGPFGVLGPDLLFSADDGIHGRELWRLTN